MNNTLIIIILLCLISTAGFSQERHTRGSDAVQTKEAEAPKDEDSDSWWSFFTSESKKKDGKVEKEKTVEKKQEELNYLEPEESQEELEKKRLLLQQRKNEINAKVSDVDKSKADVLSKMHKLRVKFLKEDPDLQKIQSKIMGLYKDMALKIDRKEGMKVLIDDLERIDIQLMVLKKEIQRIDQENEKLKSK